MILIFDTSNAARASRSISTDLVLASAQEVIGGEKGIVCVLPSVVRRVMADREMAVIFALRTLRAEREQ